MDEWRAGQVPFPSVRVTADTIIDLIPGDPAGHGHLDHICFVMTVTDLAALGRDELMIEEEGQRFGARGIADSIYVRDPDDLLVEIRAYPDPDIGSV